MVCGEGLRSCAAVCGERGKKLRAAFRDRFRNIGKTPKEIELEEWKAALAASEEHSADWIKADVWPGGTSSSHEPRLWHGLYFRAFDALQFDRFIGAMGGEGPIYYTALSRYARDHGLRGREFDHFMIFMNAIDGEYLTMMRERAEADEARRKQQPGG